MANDSGDDSGAGSGRKARPRARRQPGPRAEATLAKLALVSLTVDFYNRLKFSEALRDLSDAPDTYLDQWLRVFPGRDS